MNITLHGKSTVSLTTLTCELFCYSFGPNFNEKARKISRVKELKRKLNYPQLNLFVKVTYHQR